MAYPLGKKLCHIEGLCYQSRNLSRSGTNQARALYSEAPGSLAASHVGTSATPSGYSNEYEVRLHEPAVLA